jgi:hypothetical protein
MLCTFNVFAAITPVEARDSVVAVIRNDGATSGIVYGSGFVIGEEGKPVEYVVTNNHVVNDVENGHKNTTAIVCFSMATGDSMIANVYYSNEEKDIAILKLPEPTDKRKALVLCPMKYIDLNDTFAALGYPSESYTDWPKYSTDDITITKGGIKKIDRVDGEDVLKLDLTLKHGNSGGPLINSAGEVVGINTEQRYLSTSNVQERIDSAENYAIAIDELISVIDTDKVPITLHKSNAIWFFVGGAVILVVIIILLIVLLTRKKPQPQPQSQPMTQPHSQPMTQPQNAPNPVQRQPEKSVRLIAVSGMLNGKKYGITGNVKIGRDAQKCAVAYPVNTQGVSGVHCELSFDGSVVYIRDLNSSYGTFLANGTKLAPNTPCILKSGDKFYLASPENMFEVRF